MSIRSAIPGTLSPGLDLDHLDILDFALRSRAAFRTGPDAANLAFRMPAV